MLLLRVLMIPAVFIQRMMVMVMMVVFARMAYSMPSIAARTHIFQALEPAVGMRITMQFKIQLVRVLSGNLNERLGRAVRTFRSVPSEILKSGRARTFTNRTADR